MKQKAYEAFTGWVARRRRANIDDMQDVQKWKVSIPDHMNHTNPSFVDTSISAKKFKEQEEARLNKSYKLTATILGTDPTDSLQSETITFRLRDKVSIIARNVKRKFKLTYMIDLRIAEQQDKLKMTCTAEEAGLKEGTYVIVSRVETEEESSDTVERMIEVKVQKPGISKPWTKSILRTASTIHLYHNFVTDNQLKHGQYIIYRSDGSRISRYTTMEHLNLRKDEILIARQIDPIMIDAFWLDARKQQQNKSTFVDKNTEISGLRDILREDLFIDFECIVRIQGPEADSSSTIGSLPNLAGKLSISLCRIGQENWDNPAFTNTPIDKEIMSIVRAENKESQTFSMNAIDDATVMDFLHTIYTAD